MGAAWHWAGWTPERIELLKKMYAEGMSHTDMARKLGGGVTRNACIGKCARLGLPKPQGAGGAKASDRGTLSRLTNKVRNLKAPAVKAQNPKARQTPSMKPADVKAATWNGPSGVIPAPYKPKKPEGSGPPLNLSLVALPASGCKWPVNDGDPVFLFCGQRRFEDKPYCAGHCAGAFSASSTLARHSPKELERSLRKHL